MPPVCLLSVGVITIYQIIWVGKHVNAIMKPTNSPPQPKKKLVQSHTWATFFHTASKFSWVRLALVLDGKQTTRNPTQSDSRQTADCVALLLHVGVCLGGMVSVLKLGVVAVFDVVGLVVGFWLGSIGGGFDGGVEVGDWFEIRRRFVGRRMCLGCWCVDIVRC